MRDVDDRDRCWSCGHPADMDCSCQCCPEDTEAPAGAAAEDSGPQPVTTQPGPYVLCPTCKPPRHVLRKDYAAHWNGHWAKALSGRAATLRRDRWKRPEPPITGIRKPSE